MSQHLLKRDSSVTTGASAISLNPDKIAECHWWLHESFGTREYLEAAELIAFERFNLTLVSRVTPSTRALEISNNEGFKKKWKWINFFQMFHQVILNFMIYLGQ